MATMSAISRPPVTNAPSLNLLGGCGGCVLVMACSSWTAPEEQRPSHGLRQLVSRTWRQQRAGIAPHPRIVPARGSGLADEGFADERFERAEVTLGQVLEPATAGRHGGVRRVESGDGAQQVL